MKRVVGLDLAGSPRRTTGFCFLGRGPEARIVELHTDDEILDATRAVRPEVVSIDAPLSLPRGRRTIDDRSGPHLRSADRELQRLGIRFFPITLGPMRMLTRRGLRLKDQLESEGFHAVESYPGAAQDLLGIPRKQVGTAALRRGLLRTGLRGDLMRTDLSHDELDGVTCALVGRSYLTGDFFAIGDPSEGLMILPSRAACLARYRARGRAPDDGPPPPKPNDGEIDGTGPDSRRASRRPDAFAASAHAGSGTYGRGSGAASHPRR
jgi:predicted nuclease with RNAse H fold